MTVEEGIRNFVKENRQYEIYDESTGNGTFHRDCLGVIGPAGEFFYGFYCGSQNILMIMELTTRNSVWKEHPTRYMERM